MIQSINCKTMTTIKTKWFFKAQTEAEDQLRQLYASCSCVFQITTSDRIIELYECHNGTGEREQMQVIINKQGKSTSVLIHKLEYKYGWKVE